MNYKFVKGTANALGVKNVLSVDFSPKKACNFDCIYCGVGRTSQFLNERTEFYNISEIYDEIVAYFNENKNSKTSFILLTGSGEPALYSGFGALVDKIRGTFPEMGIMVYTNATMLSRADIQKEFSNCNIIGCNINTVYENEFRLISRPIADIHLKKILDGLRVFSKHFTGMLLVDTKFVHGINDNERSIDGLVEFLKDVQPNRYAVISKKYRGKNLSDEFIDLLKHKMTNLPFPVSFNVKSN